MEVKLVDERDTEWELVEADFRIFIVTNGGGGVASYDIHGATLFEAVAWAEREARKHRASFSVAAKGFDEGRPGLIWLVGEPV